MPEEIWKDVVGFEEFYQVSNLGRVRSKRRWKKSHKNGYWFDGRILKQSIITGYKTVTLCDYCNNKRQQTLVHVIVLEAFDGPRPKGMDCCHWDGDRTNNKIQNLRWDTRRSNFSDKKRHGTQTSGESHPTARLTDKEVSSIRDKWKQGETQRAIASEFDVHPSHISRLVRNQRRV